MPIDLEKDETGDDRLLIMYTVGSKRGSWTETEAQGPCPFVPGGGGGVRVKNEHRGWGQLGRENHSYSSRWSTHSSLSRSSRSSGSEQRFALDLLASNLKKEERKKEMLGPSFFFNLLALRHEPCTFMYVQKRTRRKR